MTSSARLILTSKKQCAKVAPRKPVKECYCYPEINKANLKSLRIRQRTTSPCRQYKNQFEVKPVEEGDDRVALISPISCETYRRIQRIDYTPRSQFLRNVQTRLCETWQNRGEGDCSPTCPRSLSYHRIMANARMQDVDSDRGTTPSKEVKHVEDQKSPATPKAPANSIASESDRDNVACSSKKETRTSSRRRSKSILRKTISSSKPTSKSPTRDERKSQSQDCRCCGDESKETGDKHEKKYSPRHHEHRIQCTQLKSDSDLITDDALVDNPIDQEVKDLRRFREQNYFETHGSSHTLVSSRSSGSLEQYMLNERLFPEPVGKIHRRDLVVTMPLCVTTERKRIHYFPRHVVRQERNVYNTNYRRKRHQSCPLTGHAIDLGILKTRQPLNSLALKYQKKKWTE